MVATHLEFLDDNCWCPDSGAMNHVTNGLEHLSISSNNTGNTKIHMGNGTGLPISHIRHASFITSSFPSNSRDLHLQNLLHVPLITKNPLSVSQFSLTAMSFLNFMQILVVSRTK